MIQKQIQYENSLVLYTETNNSRYGQQKYFSVGSQEVKKDADNLQLGETAVVVNLQVKEIC